MHLLVQVFQIQSGLVCLGSLLRLSQCWHQDVGWLSSYLKAQWKYYFQAHSRPLQFKGWGLHAFAINREILSVLEVTHILYQAISSIFRPAMVCRSFLGFEFLTSSSVTSLRKLLFIYFFKTWPHHTACGILVSQWWTGSSPPAEKA